MSESGRVENWGGGGVNIQYTVKPLPKTFYFGPPTMIRPPLFGDSLSFPLKERGTSGQPDKSQFLRPPKVVLESTLYNRFPHPPKSQDTFCPPLQPLLKILLFVKPMCKVNPRILCAIIPLG